MHLSDGEAFLLFGGLLLAVVGWIWLAVVAFRVGVLWGLATTVAPMFVAPCLAFDHWKRIRVPLLLHYSGVLMIILVRLKG